VHQERNAHIAVRQKTQSVIIVEENVAAISAALTSVIINAATSEAIAAAVRYTISN
jgi:hypothetical protein